MIVSETHGNIFDSKCQTLVCPVNIVGAMGKGLAKTFKEKFPGLFEAYRQACWEFVFSKQGFFLYSVSDDLKILCVPTKRHWKFPSKLVWIDRSLRELSQQYKTFGITSLAIPAIGCGEGMLTWSDVRTLIHTHLEPIDLRVEVFVP